MLFACLLPEDCRTIAWCGSVVMVTSGDLPVSPLSCCNLHRHGDQDGTQLPVQISEALSCGKVRSPSPSD